MLATITVTSAADAIANDGEVTLREALLAANEDRSVDGSTSGNGTDEIVFANSVSTIDLTAGPLAITSSLTVRADGRRVVLDAGDSSRHFDVSGSGVTVEFENLALLNGNAASDSGGAILVTAAAANSGSAVTIRNSEFRQNTAFNHGGAVYFAGSDAAGTPQATVTVVDSVFTANEGIEGSGGAILATGHVDVNLIGSTFVSNSAGRHGGGVMVEDFDGGEVSSATVTDSEFRSNVAQTSSESFFGGGGGGFYYFGGGLASVSGSTFIRNDGGYRGGGLLLFRQSAPSSSFQISDSVFSDNIARSGGGVAGDQLEIEDSIVRENSALTGAGSVGGIYAEEQLIVRRTLVTGNRGDFGGGIYTRRLRMFDSQVVGNSSRRSGGGIVLTGTSRILRSVIEANTAQGSGGGIHSSAGTLLVRDTRIAFNSTIDVFGGGGGGIYSELVKDLTLDRVSIIGNTTETFGAAGGGAYIGFGSQSATPADARVVISNSTIADNATSGTSAHGAGVSIDFAHRDSNTNPKFDLALYGNTVTGNRAVGESSIGGGVFVSAPSASETDLVVSSSIIAENESATSSNDLGLVGLFETTQIEHTLLGDHAGSGIDETGAGTPDADGNFAGSVSNPIDPMLQSIATYNGVLAVRALLAGSPALNAGSNPQGYSEDNRGAGRVQGSGIDIGAFEGIGTGLIRVPNVTIAEPDAGTSSADFEVTLMGTSAADVLVEFATRVGTAADTDFVPTSDSVTLPGTNGARAVLSVPVIGDTSPEREESFNLNVTTSSDDVGVLFTATHGTGTITDSDLGIGVSGNELLIFGTPAEDVVRVFGEGADYSVELNGETVLVPRVGISSVFVRTFAGNDNIDLSQLGFSTPAWIQGDTGRDTIVGTPTRDTILGGSGNDSVDGGFGADQISGDSGRDSLIGGPSNDTIDGGAGPDRIFGGAGADVLDGGAGNDAISGDGSDDTLTGGDGADNLVGGGGADRLMGSQGPDVLDGGSGNDRLIGGADNDQLDGGSGNDSMQGGSGNDILLGREGDDTLSGGNGDDILFSGQDHDILLGGNGNDSLAGGLGNDMLIGDAGTDTIRGNEGDDLLVAGRLDDVFLQSGFTRLEAVQREWLSSRSYAQRVKNVRGSSGQSDDRSNGSTYFRPLAHADNNVFDDGDAGDQLHGGTGSDYFFAHRRGENLDTVFRESGEFLNQI